MKAFHFPLNTAALCQDCHQVGSNLCACACCGSRSIMALAPLLNKPEQPSEYAIEHILYAIEEATK